MDYEDATLAKNKKFDLINQDQLLVIDHRITTRREGVVEVTQCSRTRSSSAMQLHGHLSCQSHSCGLSLCSRCSTSKVSHTYCEEALHLQTARSSRNNRRECG